MSDEQRKCPYCGMAMAADQRACPDCGNPYPFDDEVTATLPASVASGAAAAVPGGTQRPGRPSTRAGGATGGGVMAALAPHKTVLVLIGVLILIVLVGYLLFRVAMSFFEGSRPDPASLSTTEPAAGEPGAEPSASPAWLTAPLAWTVMPLALSPL